MVQAASASKNLWVAASDGDIERVKSLIEAGATPNDKDSNAYTPMHAAASYAHLDLLTYLLSVGGDINVLDEEGETPLFTVETMEAAAFLVEHGADVNTQNGEGQTAADFLEEDHPEIAAYLRSISSSSSSGPALIQPENPDGPSALALDSYANDQASALMEETRRIMEECEANGTDPEERLREVVERAVRDGIAWGGGEAPETDGQIESEDAKRRKE